MAKLPRTYNIKFSRKLFGDHLVSEIKDWIIGSIISGVVTFGGIIAVFKWNWHLAAVAIPGIIFLYIMVSGGLMVVDDWFEYRRIHLKRKKKPEEE